MGVLRTIVHGASAAALLLLAGCVTAYKTPANAPLAKLDFAYIELGDKPGTASLQGWGKRDPWVGPQIWTIGKLTPAAEKIPETVKPQISIQIAADRDFEYSTYFESSGDKSVVCSNWVIFTPVPNAEYLAVFFNKPTSCHPQVFRRTPQGLAPVQMRTPSLAAKTMYGPYGQ